MIAKESLGVVHHMILYGCYGVSKSSTEALFKQGNTGHECYRSNMPRDLRKCFVPVAVWAVGGGVRIAMLSFVLTNLQLLFE